MLGYHIWNLALKVISISTAYSYLSLILASFYYLMSKIFIPNAWANFAVACQFSQKPIISHGFPVQFWAVVPKKSLLLDQITLLYKPDYVLLHDAHSKSKAIVNCATGSWCHNWAPLVTTIPNFLCGLQHQNYMNPVPKRPNIFKRCALLQYFFAAKVCCKTQSLSVNYSFKYLYQSLYRFGHVR